MNCTTSEYVKYEEGKEPSYGTRFSVPVYVNHQHIQQIKPQLFKDSHIIDYETVYQLQQPYDDKDIKQIQSVLNVKFSKKERAQVNKSFGMNFNSLLRVISHLSIDGDVYLPPIDLEKQHLGTDIIPYIKEINEKLQCNTLVIMTGKQKYVYDIFQKVCKLFNDGCHVVSNVTVRNINFQQLMNQ